MIDYINSNKFRQISDFVLWSDQYKPFTTQILKQDAIIWCKRDYIFELFKHIQFSGRSYTLITGASDYAVGINEFSKKPKCIKKWYAQNVTYKHSDLIPIPIGLSPDEDIDDSPRDTNWFINKTEEFKLTSKSCDILYCNWSMANNPMERNNVIPKLEKNSIKYNWDFPGFSKEENELIQKKVKLWKEGKSSKKEISKLLHFYDYCNEMSKYKFVVSPPGNGIDCHRTWEALYMGAFPIVKNSVLYDEFNELPIIKVHDWSEITYDLINSYLNKKYNYEKIYMSYWRNRIKN